MEQRNLLLAIVLSVVILIGFQFVFERLHPPPPAPPVGTSTTAPATPSTHWPRRPRGPPPHPVPHRRRTRRNRAQTAMAEQPRVRIDTPRLHGSISLIGARFDDLTLATYHETVDPKSPEVVLLSPPGTESPYLAEFGWVAATPGVKVPGPKPIGPRRAAR